jgi:predicted transcriptional regulator
MPRTRGYTAEQKLDFQTKHTAETCEFLLMQNRVSKSSVAEFVGITPAAVSAQFRGKRLTVEVLIAVLSLTDADPDRIERMLKIKDA